MEIQEGVMIGGLYRHYKRGTDYRVICVAVLEADETPCVVYEALYPEAEHRFWIRPVVDFLANVEHEGKQVKRFELLPE